MNSIEYVFQIDAFTPDTLPMARLAEYLTALAKMLGHPEHTHFVRVDEGSAKLVHKVDAVDAPKVENRLNNVRIGSAPKDAMAAKQALETLLANDNAVGSLTETISGRVIIPFAGRDRAKPLSFPPFREDTTVEGQVVAVGGRDSTAHATLQDGDTFHVNLSMKRDIARDLAKLLYGPLVKLHGNGRFERQPDGVWRMLDFRVERFELLDERSIADTLSRVRSVPDNGLMLESAPRDIMALRHDESEDQ
ncbi:hypothetical protein [Sphingomonas sp. 37zxx]|uniref:hypothetical protein n=1 Tax=Sphingomonas sp. 37zxx TaxID=1550073 RepID=UPI0012E04803|nr:hypothetical protein [Sphingomonas sp. 37zxx]